MAVYLDLVGTNADRVAARKAVQVESPQMCATNNLFLLLNSPPPPSRRFPQHIYICIKFQFAESDEERSPPALPGNL